MKHKPTESFWNDFKELPDHIQKKAKKAFELFRGNPQHPGLQVHHIKGTDNPKIYELYVDISYRVTFQYGEDSIIYRRIGKHDIIDKGKY